MNFLDFEYIHPDSSGMSFRFIRPELALEFWELLAPYVERVIGKACHDEFTTEQVKHLVKSGDITLGVATRNNRIAMLIGVEEVFYLNASAVNVLAMAGEGVNEFMETLLPVFAEWLKSQGVDWLECSVSPGMERIHKRYGFETVYRNMRYHIKEKNVTQQI